ncbi:MAG: hypothetical protein K0R89_2349 [Ramlibacter sp.]|jgi:tetratricopeptide (TPR) repeat protein|nr:hypothetical protein [Ramlibacter sp.]
MTRIHTFLAVLLLGLMSLGAQAQQRSDDLDVDEPVSAQERQERGAGGGAPSLREVNQTARDGDLPKARAMIDEVIQRNPNNARAHFVKAQLASRDRDLATARAELQEAERLAPGLPFAREKAVTNLRKRLERLEAREARGDRPRAGRNARDGELPRPAETSPESRTSANATPPSSPTTTPVETRPAGEDTRNMGSGAPAERKVEGSTSSLLVGVLIGAVIAAVLAALFFRRRRSDPL